MRQHTTQGVSKQRDAHPLTRTAHRSNNDRIQAASWRRHALLVSHPMQLGLAPSSLLSHHTAKGSVGGGGPRSHLWSMHTCHHLPSFRMQPVPSNAARRRVKQCPCAGSFTAGAARARADAYGFDRDRREPRLHLRRGEAAAPPPTRPHAGSGVAAPRHTTPSAARRAAPSRTADEACAASSCTNS